LDRRPELRVPIPRAFTLEGKVPARTAIIGVLTAAALAGCARHFDRLPYMDLPPYREPGGFSSSYHRSLYGPVPPGVPIASGAPQKLAPQPGPREPEGPGYLITDERQEQLRESIPGSRFARLGRKTVERAESDAPPR
jgi:hypothetical protein